MKESTANDPGAHDLLRAVHEATYRFPEGFPGFGADVAFQREALTAAGTLRVRSPREVVLAIDLDEADKTWLRREIASMVGHRWPLSYEAADGRHALRLGPDEGHVLGRLVRHADDATSFYRVRDGQIVQAVRRMGDRRVAITTQDHLATGDGRVLPTEYAVDYWDAATGRLTRADTYSDRYIVVANVYLPASRRVVTADDAGMTTRRFTLARHHLLDDRVAAGDAVP